MKWKFAGKKQKARGPEEMAAESGLGGETTELQLQEPLSGLHEIHGAT